MNRKNWLLVLSLSPLIIGAIVLAYDEFFQSATTDSETEITSSIRPNIPRANKPIPKGGGYYRIGDPYVIAGRTYTPRQDPNYRAEGVASWYGEDFHGRLTANGEIYDMHALSAAHPTLPLPSYVRVTNLENNLSLIVRLNDRGPFRHNRLIDLSVKAAKLLGFYDQGLTRIRVEYIGRAELAGSNDRKLAATLRREDFSETNIAGKIERSIEGNTESDADSDTTGLTARTAALEPKDTPSQPLVKNDASNSIISNRPRTPESKNRDANRDANRGKNRNAIEAQFPKVIFD